MPTDWFSKWTFIGVDLETDYSTEIPTDAGIPNWFYDWFGTDLGGPAGGVSFAHFRALSKFW